MTVEPKQRVAVVVGPGRSGTSALARGLAAIGVELGAHLKPATSKNPRGFFEDLDILGVNYGLHEAFGLRRAGSSVRLLAAEDWTGVDLTEFRQRLAAIVEARFRHAPLWGFKCGGVLRLLPFWEETLAELDQDVRYVFALRNPLCIARSRIRLDYYRGIQEKCDLEWLVQVVPFLRRVLRRPCVFVDYDRMMQDPGRELGRIARGLSVPPSEALESGIRRYEQEFLCDELRHNRSDLEDLRADPRIHPLTRDVYLLLLRLASDELVADGNALEVECERIEADMSALAPVLRHVDFLENEIRDRSFGLGGFVQTRLRTWGLR